MLDVAPEEKKILLLMEQREATQGSPGITAEGVSWPVSWSASH